MSTDKPPIGLMPRVIHDNHRRLDILEAMSRYASKGERMPDEWIDELNELNDSIEASL